MTKFDAKKPFAIDRRWEVTPNTHVIVSETSNGIFTSIEDMDANGTWHHRKGSAEPAKNMEAALSDAEGRHGAEIDKASKRGRDKYTQMAQSKSNANATK